ncbi:response regulator containing a CheY-like receiver domain and an HTH DNA-binding domain [Frankia sp. QA3]|nr:response regulator containing a CheY-like receiver domain and an HTH DNA-binding domain [Frankia sp. QA3]
MEGVETVAGDISGRNLLVGRDRERRLIDGLLAAVTQRCGALVLRGEPGVGKSALLRYAERTSSARVLWLRGVESESVLPFATLADLVLPLREYLRELPDAQRAALEISVALSEGSLASPYATCAGALSLLAAAGEDRPLVLLVDDLQWVDPPSRQALLFVARRLAAERVAMLLAVRSQAASVWEGAGLPGVEVTGLSSPDCADLLAARGVRAAPHVLADLVRRVGGNPSALLEAVASLREAQLGGHEPVGELPLPGRSWERAWSERLDDLPEATRAALVVLAAGNTVPVATLGRALTAVSGSLADLDAAHDAGLVRALDIAAGDATCRFPQAAADVPSAGAGQGLAFAHPLLRAVVLRRAAPSARLRAYQALAEVCDGDAAVWYAAAGAGGPDDRVATALADVAVRTRRRAGYGASARAWHRAAELTHPREVRVDRLLHAAADAHLGGLAREAGSWADEAARLAGDSVLRADVELLRGRVLTWSGHPTRAHEQLVQAAESVVGVDPDRAGALLAEAVLPALMDGRITVALRAAQRSRLLGTGRSGHALPRSVHRGRALALAGLIGEANACLEAAAGQLVAADDVTDQQALTLAGQTLLDVEEDRSAVRLLSTVVDAARRAEAPAMLPYALAVRCELEGWRGLWAAGYADGVEAVRWAEESGQVGALGFSLVMLARIDAARGDRALCEQRIDRLRAEIGPYGIGMLDLHADGALGLAAVGHGEYDVAALTLAEAWDRARERGLGNPNAIPIAGDLAEAHIRAGEHERAAAVVAWLAERARTTGLAWPAAVAARCQGLMAEELPAAETAFAAAEQAHRRRRMPFEQARTRLCRGEVLRRLRRPAAARLPLREARVAFESLGARPWARRATAELIATGDRASRADRAVPAPARLEGLTPAELQVARAIGAGMNNVEAAAALFVSRKTVETHLTRVYRKLGIRSRSELARALVAAGIDDGLPGA